MYGFQIRLLNLKMFLIEEVVSGANKTVIHYLNQENENIGSQLNKVVSRVT